MSNKNFYKRIFNIGSFFKKFRKPIAITVVLGLSIISIVLAGYLVIKNTNQQNAQASGVLDIVLTQKVTGTAPFDSTSGPGNDTSPTDTVIRTNDTLTYEWQFSVNTITDGSANNVRISQTLPVEMKWNQLPPQCLTTGVSPVSSISSDNRTILCNLGNIANPTTQFILAQARVKGSVPNATVVTTQASIVADSSASANSTQVSSTVSAQPRFDLTKNFSGLWQRFQYGQDGTTPGWVVMYPITIQAQNGGKGSEQLASPLTFVDNISQISPNARLLTWGGAAFNSCQHSTSTLGLPNSIGGGETKVTDSGTITCNQTAPGQPINITITGLDSSLNHYPIKTAYNTPINADIAIAGTYQISVWVPDTDVRPLGATTGSINIVNRFQNFSPISISGQQNWGTGVEPNIANNNASSTLVSAASAGLEKFQFQTSGLPMNGSSALKDGNGMVTPKERFVIRMQTGNTGSETLNNVIICDKFDSTTTKVIGRSSTTNVFNHFQNINEPWTNFVYEYGQAPLWTSNTQQSNYTCENSDSTVPWSTTSTEDTNLIRVKIPTFTPANGYMFDFVMETREFFYGGANNGQKISNNHILRNYYSAKFNGGITANLPNGWRSEAASACQNVAAATGCWTDRARMTTVYARVLKETVPLPPTGQVYQALAGQDVTFKLKPTLTVPSLGTVTNSNVTLTDNLPAQMIYKNGSGMLGSTPMEPTTITPNGDGTTTLIWNLGPRAVNQTIPELTFKAVVKLETPNLSQVINTAIIDSPDDISPLANRTDTETVMVINGAGFQIIKEVPTPLIQKNENLVYNLKYANFGDQDITSGIFIDIFPYNGDGRIPVTSFTGTRPFASITGVNGETFEYTKTPPNAISNDPNHASNQSGGTTTWCSNLIGGNCPANNTEITAVRINTGLIPKSVGNSLTIRNLTLTFNTLGNQANDVYTNNFGARASGLLLPVFSNDVNIRVVKSSIADLVFDDKNADGIQDNGELGIGNTTVELYGISQTKTVTYSCDLDYSLVFTRNCDLPKFDPSLGTLTGASIDNYVERSFNQKIENTDNGSSSFTINVTGQSSVKKYDGSSYLSAVLNQVYTYTLPAFDGTIDYAGTSGISPATTVVSNQGTYNVPIVDLNTLTGSGQTFPIEFSRNSGSVSVQADSTNFSHPTVSISRGNASVTYTYSTPSGLLTTTTTDSNGNYLFDNLTSGTYQVKVIPPTNYFISPQTQGADTTKDSDINPTTGITANVVLGLNQTRTDIDAGLFKAAKIGDLVWLDSNKNGLQDSGEPGIDLVTITLLDGAGVPVTTDLSGQPIIPIRPNSSGNYLFNNLRPGSYKIQFSWDSPNIAWTTKDANSNANDATDSDVIYPGTPTKTVVTDSFTVLSGEENMTIDAGVVSTKIGDLVWLDKNANGIQDSGEPGIANVTVELYDGANNLLNTTTTNSSGNYEFTDLFPGQLPGDFKIKVVPPANYQISTKNQGGNDTVDSDVDSVTGFSDIIPLLSGTDDLTQDAGLYQKASLGNFIWNDLNQNGIQDSQEPGISGVTVNLLDGSGNPISGKTTTTDANGNYLFTDLNPGNYGIEVIKPVGAAISSKDQGSDDAKDSDIDQTTAKTGVITLQSGDNNTTVDAGLYYLPASLGNLIFIDTNKNGIQDSGELGIAGVSIQLLDGSGNAISGKTTTTDANGIYSFTNLTPGTYAIQVTVPTDYAVTSQNQGGNEVSDSDINLSGKSDNVTLIGGQNYVDLDGGVYPTYDLALTKTVDNTSPSLNGNVVYTVTVTNQKTTTVTGVSVKDLLPAGLTYVSDNSATTSTTYNQTTGIWTIGTVAGNATKSLTITAQAVTEGTITNIAQIQSADQIDVDSTPGNNVTSEDDQASVVINVQTASLGDRIWNDVNGNGIQDNGEVGIAGVTVNLLDASGNVIPGKTTTTDANGNYLFGNLVPGTYAIQIVIPADYVVSSQNQGGNEATDSDLNLSGKSDNVTLTGGQTNNDLDGGLKNITADLGVTKTHQAPQNGSTFNATETVTYTLTVTNNGVSKVTEFKLVESIPSQLTNPITFTPATGSYDQNSNVWSGLNLNSGQSVTMTVTAKIDSSVFTMSSTAITNTVTISEPKDGNTNLTDKVAANNTASDVINTEALASLGDKIFNDTNKNGIQDSGELGIAGVSIQLLDGSGNAISGKTTTTDANGNYQFTNLTPGTYAIQVTVPTDYAVTSQNQGGNEVSDSDINLSGKSDNVTLIGGQNYVDLDGGVYPTYDLALTKIVDNTSPSLNGNIVYTVTVTNQKTTTVTGVSVKDLLPAGLTYVSDNSATTSTTYNQTTGIWTIGSIAGNQTKTLTITAQAVTEGTITNIAQVQTADQVDVDSTPGNNVTSEDDQASVVINVQTASLGDRIWNDVNGNGIQDNGEVGIAGVTVNLLDASGNVIPGKTTTTDANGNYLFPNLAPGNYIVEIIPPANYKPSPVNQGSDDTKNSKVDPTTKKTQAITLTPGSTITNADGGLYQEVDLFLTKAQSTGGSSNNTITVGQNITYTLTLTNSTQITATGVTVKEMLPSGLQFVSAVSGNNGSDGTYDNTAGIWTIGTVAGNATKTLTITAKVTTAGSITNTAQIQTTDQKDVDSTPGNKLANEDDQASVTLTANPTPAQQQQQQQEQMVNLVRTGGVVGGMGGLVVGAWFGLLNINKRKSLIQTTATGGGFISPSKKIDKEEVDMPYGE